MVYPYNGILFSEKKGVGVLIRATTWINLKNIVLSEQRYQRPYILLFHLHEMSTIGKSIET